MRTNLIPTIIAAGALALAIPCALLGVQAADAADPASLVGLWTQSLPDFVLAEIYSPGQEHFRLQDTLLLVLQHALLFGGLGALAWRATRGAAHESR